MPNYAKFLKDMVTRKKRIEEFEAAAATETCLALMHNKIPVKKTDPGSFTIECFIGQKHPTKALCDPGASINLMPKSVFRKLGIGEAKPTTVMLQLADHSYVQPEGKIEDILVKVDKFIFPADFLILDCEADENAPIILGRPFLSTSRAMIDFDKDEIVFKVDDNQIKVKSLTKQLDKGKGIAKTPTKDIPRRKLYIGEHIERDRAAMKKPTKEKGGKAQGTSPEGPARQKIPTGRKLQLNPHSVSRTQLLPEAKLWNTFIKRNLLPTSHNQTVDRTRLVLIHTIITGYRINVGEILAKELAAACSNDKGILAFPCLISALCRRADVPTSPSDKYQAEKKGWTRAVYMRKMDVADATPINMAMPTPPASSDHMPAAPTDEAGSFNPTTASPTPAEPSPSIADSPITNPAQHTQPSPAATPTDLPANRESTPDSPMGSTPEASHPPPPAQSEEAVPIHILQLRNQLQRIETRQLLMQEETKVFQQRLINFLCYQFPAAATYFNAQPEATAAAPNPTNTQPTPSVNPSAQAGDTVEVHFSSDDENDPALETQHRRKGKTTAGRVLKRTDQSSPDEEADHQPAQKRRRRIILTSDSDDDLSATVPTSSADASFSLTF
ncbi:hypothetical protein V6N13_059268 [Hibiscus sabdariffa]